MRTLLLVAAVSTVLLLGGCSDPEPSATPTSPSPTSPASPSSSAPSSAAPDAPFTPAPAGPDVAAGEACAEVRAGIDAFNLGAYDETVEHFQDAIPLAQGAEDGSLAAAELTEAVRYYAGLAADDYLEASESSPQFAKYKAITLTPVRRRPGGAVVVLGRAGRRRCTAWASTSRASRPSSPGPAARRRCGR